MVLVPVLGAAGVWAVREFVRPANALGLSLFRPYRGDPWPKGVQEDYDVHFDWSPRRAAPAPIQPTWSDIVVSPSVGDRDPGVSPAAFAGDVEDVEIEDLVGETAAISQVQGDIRIAPH
jgi:hypothetical protein